MLRAGRDVREYHLDAELLHEFRQPAAQSPAYGSIVGRRRQRLRAALPRRHGARPPASWC